MTALAGRVLLVLPDPEVCAPATLSLASCGHDVIAARDGISGRQRALQQTIDLVIMARALDRDGLELLSSVHHTRPHLPIIVLATHPTSEDCIKCLNQGAIDYLPVSVSPEELTARVTAHLRLSSHHTPVDPSRLRVGDVELDRVNRRVTRGTSQIMLTPRESDILAYLMQHAGLVITRARLHHVIWGCDFDPGTNVVEVYVGYLRRKLGPPEPIKTVRGLGYRLTG